MTEFLAATTEQAYASVGSLIHFASWCSRKHTDGQFVAMTVGIIAASEGLQWCGGNPKTLGRDFSQIIQFEQIHLGKCT